MRSDGPLILAVLFLAGGLTVVFAYGTGTAGFNAAYPFSAANLNMSISTAGPAAIGGMGLVALGLLLMAWALLAAIVSQFMVFGTERGRAARMSVWSRIGWTATRKCWSGKSGLRRVTRSSKEWGELLRAI